MNQVRTALDSVAAPATSLFVIAAVALLSLHYPFVADQIVPFYAAKTLHAGGTLYIDFWDNKLPGLVWFHLLAGRLFGFDEAGVRILETIWMLLFSLLLILATRRSLGAMWIASFVPVAVVGTYYAVCDSFHMTQLEILTGLPILLGVWAAAKIECSPQARSVAYFVVGLCGATTMVFKVVFAPMFAAFFLLAAVVALVRHRVGLASVITSMFVPAMAGGAVVIGLVAARFWLDGALEELYWTAFVYPPAALATSPPAPKLRLFESSLFFLAAYSVWLPFALIAMVDWLRRRDDLFVGLTMVWFVTAGGLILIQTFSWWPYHFLMLFTPTGILGVRGATICARYLEAGGSLMPRQRNRAIALILLCACASLVFPTYQKIAASVEVFVRRQGGPEQFHDFVNIQYREVKRSTRFLSASTARPGAIYVFGDPLYYYLSGREPALPIIGWPWEFFLQEQWEALPGQLEQARPPYIYVDKDNYKMMEVRRGGVVEYLTNRYARFATDARGTWYQRVAQ